MTVEGLGTAGPDFRVRRGDSATQGKKRNLADQLPLFH